jgi:hypothetical protein
MNHLQYLLHRVCQGQVSGHYFILHLARSASPFLFDDKITGTFDTFHFGKFLLMMLLD